MLNGLTILGGSSPTHVDHPGTPLQVFIGLTIVLQWAASRFFGFVSEGIFAAVIAQPEAYLHSVAWALLLLNGWALYFLGRRMFQVVGSIRVALFCQSAPLAFSIVAPRVAYPSPEAILIFASLCLVGLLSPILIGKADEKNHVGSRIAPVAGALCGLGAAVKITFLPMLGLLLLLGSRENIRRALKYALITGITCLLPVLGNLKRMVDWFYSLAIHSGRYGTGSVEILDVAALQERMDTLLGIYPLFYGVLAALLLCVAYMGVRSLKVLSTGMQKDGTRGGSSHLGHPKSAVDSKELWVPSVLLGVGVLQTAIVLKHPGVHYMIPVLPLTFVSIVWMAQSGNVVVLPKQLTNWLQYALLGLAFVLPTYSSALAFDKLRGGRVIQRESLDAIESELKKYSNPLVIGGYRCTLPKCALAFGAGYAPSLDKEIVAASALSDFYAYNIWNKQLRVAGEGWVSLERIDQLLAARRDVFLVSPAYPELDVFSLEEIVNTPVQSLYRVTGLANSRL
jgi:hypothetical protein